MSSIGAHILVTCNARDPVADGALDGAGRLRILPAEFWHRYSQEDIALFCHRQAIYCVPTVELVAWLHDELADKKAIEIGAGTGVLAAALDIPATDNRMQEWPEIVLAYAQTRQPVITYGDNVAKLDADVAMAKHRPEAVVAAWVTHKWKPSQTWREGNMYGVEEEKIVRRATYVFVGHEHVHRHKPILDLPHETHYPDWLVSRALSPGRNYIKIWRRDAAQKGEDRA